MAIGHRVAQYRAEKEQAENMAEAKPQTDDTAALKEQLATLQAQMAMLAAGQPGAKALELLAERSAPKNNPNYNEVSPYTHPEGELVKPKAKLARPTFFCGGREREDTLTPHEIDLYNQFAGTRSSRNGTWTAEVRQNGSAQELYVNVPAKSVDERMGLPPLSLILFELLQGQAAADPTRLAERVAELEAKLAKSAA
jgi:hypothetical protein